MIKRVLCVDDTEIDRVRLKKILTDAGYEVATVASAPEAIDRVSKGLRPDLILMDIVMPEMDGFSAYRALKNSEAGKNIPVVFVSSKSEQADKVWAQLLGAKAYITKPYQQEEILSQIRGLQA